MGERMENSVPPEQKSLSESMFTGALWMFAMSWLIRLLSIISISVLARLLDKEDFGLIAITSAIVMLPVVLLDLGLEQAIIREEKPTPSLYNTAWTIKVFQMSIVAVVLAISAPWIADLYQDPRITDILYVLSGMIFIRGLENLWVVFFRKELNFHKDFLYETICKLLAVVVTIGLAWYYRSYWALVYGQAAVAVIRLTLSMIIAPQRPSFHLGYLKNLWGFSQWSMVKGLAFYFIMQADKLIIGRFSSIENVGAYALGREISDLPVRDISAPANRALGSGFSRLQGIPDRLVSALMRSVNAISSITFPIGLGLAVTAPQAVPVMLGEGWHSTILILQILACSSAFTAVAGLLANTLVVVGYVRDVAIIMWVRAIALVLLGIPAAMYGDIVGMALAVLGAEFLNACGMILNCKQRIPTLRKRQILQSVATPALCAGLMVVSVVLVNQFSGIENLLVLLSVNVLTGATVYVTALYSIWWLRGRPDTIEAMALDKVRKGFQSVKRTP
jgi:lipopolysaccharide exporter